MSNSIAPFLWRPASSGLLVRVLLLCSSPLLLLPLRRGMRGRRGARGGAGAAVPPPTTTRGRVLLFRSIGCWTEGAKC